MTDTTDWVDSDQLASVNSRTKALHPDVKHSAQQESFTLVTKQVSEEDIVMSERDDGVKIDRSSVHTQMNVISLVDDSYQDVKHDGDISDQDSAEELTVQASTIIISRTDVEEDKSGVLNAPLNHSSCPGDDKNKTEDEEELVNVEAFDQHSHPGSPNVMISVSSVHDSDDWSDEELKTSWEDATRYGTGASTPSRTNAIVQPAEELFNAVYDVAADINRRWTNWWHSRYPDDMPEELDSPPMSPDLVTAMEQPSMAEKTQTNASSSAQSNVQSSDEKNADESASIVNHKQTGFSWTLGRTTDKNKLLLSKHGIWLLGRRYKLDEQGGLSREFRLDFYSRIWCTYRSQFEPIGNSDFTSDAGWGCMMRTGQSLLAQALLFHHIGRDWRYSRSPEKNKQYLARYTKILSWFHDNPEAPFSLHRMAILGAKSHGKRIGEWFGPSTVGHVLLQLNNEFGKSGLRIHLASEGVIYRDLLTGVASSEEVVQSLLPVYPSSTALRFKTDEAKAFRPTLILVALRLGVEQMNSSYYASVKMYLAFPQSVGIAGGRPSSSLYFVGFDGDYLLYLDPHCTRPAIPLKSAKEYTFEDFSSYHCPRPMRVRIQRIDPCMLVGFYCKDYDDFEDFCRRVKQVAKFGTPAFTIEPAAPVYGEDLDFSSVSSEGES